MITYVQNKLIKNTIIVDISILGFIAHCMRPTVNVLAKRCLFALCVENTLCIRYQIATFFRIRTQFFFFFFVMRGLCVAYVCLGQTSVDENPTKTQQI